MDGSNVASATASQYATMSLLSRGFVRGHEQQQVHLAAAHRACWEAAHSMIVVQHKRGDGLGRVCHVHRAPVPEHLHWQRQASEFGGAHMHECSNLNI